MNKSYQIIYCIFMIIMWTSLGMMAILRINIDFHFIFPIAALVIVLTDLNKLIQLWNEP